MLLLISASNLKERLSENSEKSSRKAFINHHDFLINHIYIQTINSKLRKSLDSKNPTPKDGKLFELGDLKDSLRSQEVGDGVSVEVNLGHSVSDSRDLVVDQIVHQFTNVHDEGVLSGYRDGSVLVLVQDLRCSMILRVGK